jgi:hypothetical protein
MLLRLALLVSASRAAEYCGAGNTVTGDSNLGQVRLTGVQGTSISDDSNCPGATGVIDLTSKKASVQPGGTYVLNFQATTCESGWARYTYAFIDFNGNGVYDTSELIGQQNVDNRVAPMDLAFSFNPPCEGSGSVVGTTRMRIFVVESGFNANPCLTFSYGGVKEFSIEIIAAPGADCGGSNMSTGEGMSGGSKFLITIFVLLFVYFVGSAIYVLKVRPEHRDKIWFAPLTKDFWVSFLGHVKVGCQLSKSWTQQLIARAQGKKDATSYDVI